MNAVSSLTDAVGDARTVLVFTSSSTGVQEDERRQSWSLTANGTDVLVITDSVTINGGIREQTPSIDPSPMTTPVPVDDLSTRGWTSDTSGSLVEIGTRTSERLREWSDTDGQPTVHFDSLTALLRQIEPRDAFRLMHALCGEVKATDAVMYVWMDPDAHDEPTWRTFAYLFEAVIEPDRTGKWNRLETQVRVE